MTPRHRVAALAVLCLFGAGRSAGGDAEDQAAADQPAPRAVQPGGADGEDGEG